MDDMISRQAAIKALCKRCDLVQDENEPCMEKCNDIKILENLPSAQQWTPYSETMDEFEVIAWYPLPKPYRKENNQ